MSYSCGRTYKELLELATTCAKQAHITTSKDVARELWRMAVGCQQQAAHFNAGKLPDIGEMPAHLRLVADQQLIEVNAKSREQFKVHWSQAASGAVLGEPK